MVLGLSLTSDRVVWVLVDEADGSVADHDCAEFQADTEIAGAAARGAHAIATAGGLDVTRIRLTWSPDVTRDGLRLRSQLGGLGFDNVEAVPLTCACAVMVDPNMEPGLALAYGAALAEVGLRDAITVPLCTRATPRRRRRGRMAMAVLGAAAAAAVGGLLLTSGAQPQIEQAAATVEQPPSPDPGWVAVSAPSDNAVRPVRKVVEEPVADTSVTALPVTALPVTALPVAETPVAATPVPAESLAAQPVEPAPATLDSAAPAASPAAGEPVPLAVPHLPAEVPHLAAPAPEAIPAEQPHLIDEQPALGPAPEMTDPANVFTALP